MNQPVVPTFLGRFRIMQSFLRGAAPAEFYLALGVTPVSDDSTTLAGKIQIQSGDGYEDGGIRILRDVSTFTEPHEMEGAPGGAEIYLADQTWIATGEGLFGIRYVYLTTGGPEVGAREIIAGWDLGREVPIVHAGQTFTLTDYGLCLPATPDFSSDMLVHVLNAYFRGVQSRIYMGFGMYDPRPVPEIYGPSGYFDGGIRIAPEGPIFGALPEIDESSWSEGSSKSLTGMLSVPLNDGNAGFLPGVIFTPLDSGGKGEDMDDSDDVSASARKVID